MFKHGLMRDQEVDIMTILSILMLNGSVVTLRTNATSAFTGAFKRNSLTSNANSNCNDTKSTETSSSTNLKQISKSIFSII